MKKEKIIIFDTTLRDGQQCPWAWMSFENNIEFAKLASLLWVDVLEAWFPSASKLDFEIVSEISKQFWGQNSKMKICWLCQLREEQIDITIRALTPAIKYNNARLHVYLPVDPILLEASLWAKSKDKSKLVQNVHDLVSKAVKAWLEVEFSPEGYSRLWDNFDFTTKVIEAAIKWWASTINCPDTVWWACKFEWDNYYLENIKKHKLIIDKLFPGNSVFWSCHNHNDLWLATENSINAIIDGPVRQIEVCVNSIWERAGNASLEQCVMIINNFWQQNDTTYYTDINLQYLKQISDFVDKFMLKRQAHFPITWDNAARHSSGWHTNAILKNPLVYQPFDPKEVWSGISIVFWPLSWSNHAKNIILKFWYKFDDSEKTQISQFIKDFYSDRRKWITDDQVLEWYFEYRKPIKIDEFNYSKDKWCSTIEFSGKFFSDDKINEKCKWKDSALAALTNAIKKHYQDIKIQNYQSKSVWSWINAKSQSKIIILDISWQTYEWIWIDEDIEISAFKALINAVNKSYIDLNFKIK